MTFSLQLYKSTETSFVAGNLLFGLDPEDASVEDSKTLESLDLPSLVWNDHFDSSIVTGRWTFRGKFRTSDATWSGVPNFTGRGYDFIHQLRSLFKGVSATTGDYPYATDTDMFIMVLMEKYDATERTYNAKTAYSTNPVYIIPERYSFDKKGGEIGIVEYNISFLEVAGVTRI